MKSDNLKVGEQYPGQIAQCSGRVNFFDAQDVSGYADEAMHWCVMKNIIGGAGGNQLDPQGIAAREQVAAILHRFCENIVK